MYVLSFTLQNMQLGETVYTYITYEYYVNHVATDEHSKMK